MEAETKCACMKSYVPCLAIKRLRGRKGESDDRLFMTKLSTQKAEKYKSSRSDEPNNDVVSDRAEVNYYYRLFDNLMRAAVDIAYLLMIGL